MKYYLLTILLALPSVLLAQNGPFLYDNPLVAIPGYTPGDGLSGFVNVIYGVSISVAALLAVIKIVIAGVKWMLSDVVTDKTSAKKDIQGALFGLIVIISAVLIISIINPDIVGAG
jgi:hypothetical protein